MKKKVTIKELENKFVDFFIQCDKEKEKDPKEFLVTPKATNFISREPDIYQTLVALKQAYNELEVKHDRTCKSCEDWEENYYELHDKFSKEICGHEETKKSAKNLLKTLKKDAKMALKGKWGVSTDEGKEGFQSQIILINAFLDSLKKSK